MKVRIPRTDADEQQADDELKPWQRDVPEGWHAVRVKAATLNKYDKRGEKKILTVQLVVGEAWVDMRFDLEEDKDARRLGKLASACGLDYDPDDGVDTDELEGWECEVKIAHGGEKRQPPGHWLNVVGFRSLDGEGGATTGTVPEDLPF